MSSRRTSSCPNGAPHFRTKQTHLTGNRLEFAWHGYQIIKAYGGAPRTIIQAGTAQWPRVPPHLDDGVSATHFSYEWNVNDSITRMFASGLIPLVPRTDGHMQASLPEMQVWLACPDSGEVIDFTTGQWPTACREIIGEEWLADRAPEYLWTFGAACREAFGTCPTATPSLS